jgi:hypothetical protein
MNQNRDYFYLFILVARPSDSHLQRLKNSANLNGRSLSFQCAIDGGAFLCTCLLDGIAFGSSHGSTRNKAKLMAVKKTIQIMETIYPTIEVTSAYNTTKLSTLDLAQENFAQALFNEVLCFASETMLDVLTFELSVEQTQQLDAIHQSAYQFNMKSNVEYKTLEGGKQQITIWITKQSSILQVYYYLRAGGLSPKYKLK